MMENEQIKHFPPSANSFFFFFHELSDSKMIRSNKFLRAIHDDFMHSHSLFHNNESWFLDGCLG